MLVHQLCLRLGESLFFHCLSDSKLHLLTQSVHDGGIRVGDLVVLADNQLDTVLQTLKLLAVGALLCEDTVHDCLRDELALVTVSGDARGVLELDVGEADAAQGNCVSSHDDGFLSVVR